METFVLMNLANSKFFTIARILFPTGEMFTDGAEMSRHLPSTRTTFDTVVTSMLFMPPAMRALQMSEMTTFISLLILTSFRDVVAVMAWIELCATRESHSVVDNVLLIRFKFRKWLFMLHVPLDSIIESVIAVGGVSLWLSSVCWDTH